MSNLLQDLIEAADNEPIEYVVLGAGGWEDYNLEAWGEYPKNELLTLEEVSPYLNKNYDTGYGAPDGPCLYAWTATKVIFRVQYDGSTSFYSIPRNPVAVEPEMPGGG